nr:hypothetical protein [Tanacetum cinerariifolium]
MNLLNEGCSANPPAQNQPYPGYSSQYASMTPEQFNNTNKNNNKLFFDVERGVAVMATCVAQVVAVDGVHRLAGTFVKGTFSAMENGIASMSPPY